MRVRITAITMAILLCGGSAFADLEPWTDYDVSDNVYSVSTIQVKPNMDDAYLEGIRETWVKTNELAKELGQIKDYAIYRSDLPQSGDFNLLLVVEFANTADLAPNKERYDAFVEAMTKELLDENSEMAQRDYPGMREITGQYLLRKITIK